MKDYKFIEEKKGIVTVERKGKGFQTSPIQIKTPILQPGTYVVTKGEQQAHKGLLLGMRIPCIINGSGEIIEGPDQWDRYYVQMDKGQGKVWIGRPQLVVKGR